VLFLFWVGSTLMMEYVRARADMWLRQRASKRAERAEIIQLMLTDESDWLITPIDYESLYLES
jgi:hypothetical protein